MVGWPPSVPQWEWDFVQGTDPTTDTTVDEGNTWYDSTNNEGYVYDGAAWISTTVGEYLELGGTLPPEDVPNDTIITRMIAADAVTNTQVAENAVDTPELVADAVTNALVAAGAIDTEQVANDAITTALIAADAVTNTQVAENAVDTPQIVADAVTNTEIASNAVDSAQLVASAVDEAHLSFATATQAELDGHAGDTTNPHNVDDSQTGAATALTNHAGDAGAHHKQLNPGIINKAETFAESDVTLSHSTTKVDNEHIEIGRFEHDTITNLAVPANGTATWNVAEADITSRVIYVSQYGDYRISVDDVTVNGTSLGGGEEEKDISGFSSPLDIEVTFYCDDDYERNADASAELSAVNGSATVEWPNPPAIDGWDQALFQQTLDNESVGIYIEENDGSGWIEIAGPINRGDSIPATSSSEVRFRIDFSRVDRTNNPTLDAIYRRYTV